MSEKYIINCAEDEYLLFDGRISSKTFTFEADGLEHLISCFPLGKGVPKSAKISTATKEIYGDIFVTRWGGGVYELSFNRDSLNRFKEFQAVAEARGKHNGVIHTATAFNDETQKLLISNGTSNVIYDFGRKPDKTHIDITQLSFGLMFIVTGYTEGGQFLLIALAEDNYKLLFMGEADSITFGKRSFVTRKKLNDMLGRIIVEEYSFFEDLRQFKIISRSYDYENDREYVPMLVPYLLLEAVMSKDLVKAQTYLASDLNAEMLTEYLGEFSSVEFPKYRNDGEEIVAVMVNEGKNEKYAREFQFEVSDGLVVNVTEVKNGARVRLKNLFSAATAS
ncbi:MAG: hypothetical protein ACI4MT_02165 [Christensenellales bacterium]